MALASRCEASGIDAWNLMQDEATAGAVAIPPAAEVWQQQRPQERSRSRHGRGTSKGKEHFFVRDRTVGVPIVGIGLNCGQSGTLAKLSPSTSTVPCQSPFHHCSELSDSPDHTAHYHIVSH
jgi:hypothetical protein